VFKGITKTARRQRSYFGEQQFDPYAQMDIPAPGIESQLYNIPPELRPYYLKMFRARAAKAYGIKMPKEQKRRRG